MLTWSFSWKGFHSISIPFLSFPQCIPQIIFSPFLITVKCFLSYITPVRLHRLKISSLKKKGEKRKKKRYIACWFLWSFFEFCFILSSGRIHNTLSPPSYWKPRKSMYLCLGILRLPFISWSSTFSSPSPPFFFKLCSWIWLLVQLKLYRINKKLFSHSLIYKITSTMSSWHTISKFQENLQFSYHMQKVFVNKAA